jgi:hypothetical protein
MLFLSNSFLKMVFSVIDIFPQVSLNFAGGASLNLRPRHYLIQQNYVVSIQASIYFCLLSVKLKRQLFM